MFSEITLGSHLTIYFPGVWKCMVKVKHGQIKETKFKKLKIINLVDTLKYKVSVFNTFVDL